MFLVFSSFDIATQKAATRVYDEVNARYSLSSNQNIQILLLLFFFALTELLNTKKDSYYEMSMLPAAHSKRWR